MKIPQNRETVNQVLAIMLTGTPEQQEEAMRFLMHKHEPFNQLQAPEAERLALLLEEMGETQQIIGKILRHGIDNKYPADGPTNRELLEKELGDVFFALSLMLEAGDVSEAAITARKELKRETAKPYLHHQEL